MHKLKKLLITTVSAAAVLIAATGICACDFGGVELVHTYGEWVEEVGTCTERVIARTCTKCGKVQRETAEPRGHVFGEWTDKTNTCTDHTQSRICAECGAEDTQKAEPKGHVYGEGTEILNTCTEHTEIRVCKVCDEETLFNLIPKGHVFSDDVCTVCGATGFNGEGLEWLDRYNNKYGLNYFLQNGMEDEAELYSRIDEQARLFHVDYSLEGLGDGMNGGVIVADIKMDDLELGWKKAVSVWKTFKDDNPLYYWMANSTYGNDEEIIVLASSEYASGKVRAQLNSLVYDKVNEYTALTDEKDNAYRKALAFHDKILDTIDYAYDDYGFAKTDAWAHNVLGVFEEKGGVCESYARTFQLLLNYNGIENLMVTGVGNGERHGWNLVRLDDGNWYWCDLTWDDAPSQSGIMHNYFMVNDLQDLGVSTGYDRVTFIKYHLIDTPENEREQFLYELPARSKVIYRDEVFLTVGETFKVDNCTYSVTGYGTVKLIKNENKKGYVVPKIVSYNDVEYTVKK